MTTGRNYGLKVPVVISLKRSFAVEMQLKARYTHDEVSQISLILIFLVLFLIFFFAFNREFHSIRKISLSE